jgi:hypothetical protein
MGILTSAQLRLRMLSPVLTLHRISLRGVRRTHLFLAVIKRRCFIRCQPYFPKPTENAIPLTWLDLRKAGRLGFEPRLNESESFVLPLHYQPKYPYEPLFTVLAWVVYMNAVESSFTICVALCDVRTSHSLFVQVAGAGFEPTTSRL